MNRLLASLATVLVDGAWAAVFARLGEPPVESGPAHREEVGRGRDPRSPADRTPYRD